MQGSIMESSPYVEIIEQPASKTTRFRYKCEKVMAKNISGVNSTRTVKTFPTLRIVGHNGPAKVIISCVTKDEPYRPHPHMLTGKDKKCKEGIHTIDVPAGRTIVTCGDLHIVCVKKMEIEESLTVRQELRIDPFQTGFDHKNLPTSIDLTAVRLCFQVFVEGSQLGKFNKPLPPIVSNPIYDKKAGSELIIYKLSHCSATVAGGLEMILLCDKIAKDDLQIRFYEQAANGLILWEGYGDFYPTQVHKQAAVWFKTPRYYMQQVEQPVQVYIQLKRPSDGAMSKPLQFYLLPLDTDDIGSLKRKRMKIENDSIFAKLSKSLIGRYAPSFNGNNDKWMPSAENTNTIRNVIPQPGSQSLQSHNDTQTQEMQITPKQEVPDMGYNLPNPFSYMQQHLNIPHMQPNMPVEQPIYSPEALQLYQANLRQLFQSNPLSKYNSMVETVIESEDSQSASDDARKPKCLNLDGKFDSNYSSPYANFELFTRKE